jgi:hypothetical protein
MKFTTHCPYCDELLAATVKGKGIKYEDRRATLTLKTGEYETTAKEDKPEKRARHTIPYYKQCTDRDGR